MSRTNTYTTQQHADKLKQIQQAKKARMDAIVILTLFFKKR